MPEGIKLPVNAASWFHTFILRCYKLKIVLVEVVRWPIAMGSD